MQRTFGMTARPDVPLISGVAGAPGETEGFDIVLKSRRAWSSELQFIFLGMGEPWYQAALSELAAARPQEVVVEFGFTDALEHRLIAGADIVLMPSLYEPCGLTQMRAQRYGTPVIGRLVGGIGDTVEDDATGCLFGSFDEFALDEAIDRAVDRFTDRAAWTRMMKRAMARDFGWKVQAERYDDAYRSAEQVASSSRSVVWQPHELHSIVMHAPAVIPAAATVATAATGSWRRRSVRTSRSSIAANRAAPGRSTRPSPSA